MIMWNDPDLTRPIADTIFPVLAATHQVNRVAALAVSAAEVIEYGKFYMEQIVKNSKALGKALDERGIPILCAHKGYSQSHQVIARVKQFGGGLEVAHRLAEANIITNKNLVPEDKPEKWDHPSGLRIGTIEITRLGMNENDMETIADFFARVLIENEEPESVGKDVVDFRYPQQTLYYNFDNGYPAWAEVN
jgi:glycine hydroxymethyltransferase